MNESLRTMARVAVLVAVLASAVQAADVPGIIAYQGRISVSGGPYNGTGQFKFALVNTAGTTTYWSNDGTGVAGAEPTAAVLVGVQGGLFTVLLGDTNVANMTVVPPAVFQNNDVALRIWFKNGAPGSVFELLSPDRRIAVAGYAMLAQDSNNLGGQPAAFYRDAGNLNAGTVPVARLPVATSGVVGTVRPDGTTITVDASGVLTAAIPAVPVTSVAGKTGAVSLTSSDVGLGNVDNTSDVNKPVSTAQATALATKLTAANNLTDVANAATARSNLGLGNVDNTSDANKPVSTAQATALATKLTAANNLSDLANAVTARSNLGLGNVDNTSDANKPVSTAQATALATKLTAANNLSDVANAATARSNLGLANVDNTSDVNKPVSTAQQAALDLKAPLASPAFTGTVTGISATMVGLGNVTNAAQLTASQLSIDGILAANLDTNVPSQKAVKTYVDTGLAAKQATITGAATSITGSNLATSVALVSDGSGKVAASAVTATELGFVSGVTSAVQTQLNAKQATITGAATSITGSNLATSVALVSDGSGKVAASAVTATELGFVSGVTSAVQTQLNAKASTGSMASSGLTMGTGNRLGRSTAGSGAIEELSGTQATAMLSAVVGDSGSGGTKGLVPAPALGDAAAGKFLKADGIWTAPSVTAAGGSPTHVQYNSGGAFAGSANLTFDATTGTGGLAIGNTTTSTSTGTGALRVGGGLGVVGAGFFGGEVSATNAYRFAAQTVIVGNAAAGAGSNPIAIGSGTDATTAPSVAGNYGLAIGAGAVTGARAAAADAIAIGSASAGNAASAAGAQSIAIGRESSAAAPSSVAIGAGPGTGLGAVVTGAVGGAIAIGGGTTSVRGAYSTHDSTVAIGGAGEAGAGASTSERFAIAIGSGASASSRGAIALGCVSRALNGNYNIAIGNGAMASGNADSVALGSGVIAAHDFSVAIGKDATTTKTNQMVLGKATNITEVNIPATTASTSTTTGTLVVGGGAGIAGAVFAGGAITTTSTTDSTSSGTGSLIASGGVGITKTLSVGGGMNLKIATKSADYTVDSGAIADHSLIVDTTAGNVTITLPGSPMTGKIVVIKTKVAGNSLIISPNGGTIDGSGSDFTLTVIGSMKTLQFDGTAWWIISESATYAN